ncbi:MAG: hypothetical protein RQM90_12460 [Methanoculleus sp.]
MIADHLLEFVEMSSTQRARTGKQAFVNNHSIFSKHLHHGCSAGADIIVVCVDNDEEPEKRGVGRERITWISTFYEAFLEKNTFYQSPPCLVCAVPVLTIDYWVKAISLKKTECSDILLAMSIPKGRVNYPALAGGASCFIPLPIGSESTGPSARSTPDTPTRF